MVYEMGNLPAVAALALFLSASACSAEHPVVPDFTLATPEGMQIRLDDEVREHTTVLLFWATWCPYCKALMPHLQSIRLEYGDAVEILAINFKDDGDPVSFIANAGYDFTLLLNGDAVAEEYGVEGTPGLFIVDNERVLRFNLRDLPTIEPPNNGQPAGHTRRAAYRAPYWAAEIRKSIDSVTTDPAAGKPGE